MILPHDMALVQYINVPLVGWPWLTVAVDLSWCCISVKYYDYVHPSHCHLDSPLGLAEEHEALRSHASKTVEEFLETAQQTPVGYPKHFMEWWAMLRWDFELIIMRWGLNIEITLLQSSCRSINKSKFTIVHEYLEYFPRFQCLECSFHCFNMHLAGSYGS